MLALFLCTSFVAAALLFWLEPMVAKMVLPLLGGSPSVWNTCMVFFQAALLAGYAYAHAALARLGVRKAALLHAAVAVAALLALPLELGEAEVSGWPADANPAPRLLALLVWKVGPPFLVIAATAPLLQRWVSASGLRAGRDPYFLYAASNAGSLTALLLYPLAIERALGLRAQSELWRWGYAGLAGLVLVCAAVAALGRGGTADLPPATATAPIGPRARLRWMTLAAVPSALLIGATAHLATDIASFPLLWVLPLALYLLTFVLAFGRPRLVSTRVASLLLPLPLPAAFIFAVAESSWSGLPALVLHATTLFLAGLVCHGRLADERPPPAQLTSFYLWIAGGGALGGAFAGLLAPLLFDRVVEYPVEMIAACFLRPAQEEHRGAGRPGRADLAWAIALAALSALMGLVVRGWGLPAGPLVVGLMFGLPVAVNYLALARPARFAAGLTGVLVVSHLVPLSPLGRTLESERTFFGVLRVATSADGQHRELVHGTTLHGLQAVSETRRREPLAYYHRSGPLGQIFTVASDPGSVRAVAVLGMGVGTAAAYARPGQRWTFYEIDPAVVRIARDPRFFTYLADAFPGDAGLRIEVGDARLRLRGAAEASFDVMVLDAFSADAIPVHLLVREAVSLYRRKLAPDGLLAFHISNRYLDLQPVVAALARDAGLAVVCRSDPAAAQRTQPGKLPSDWCVAARDHARLARLTALPAWHPPRANDRPVWTDDRSSLVEALR